MKQTAFALALLTSSAMVVVPANALSVYFFAGSSALGGTTIFEDFEGVSLDPGTYGDTIAGSKVFSGGVSGQAARPNFGSTGNFLAVQADEVVAQSLPGVQVLSFIIGSLDSYNQVVLKFADNTTATFDGSQIAGPNGCSGITCNFPDNGSPTSNLTNGRVFFDAEGLQTIVGFELRSFGQNAFEIDDISIAAPEPATWGLLILGVGMAGANLRRRGRASNA